ncbi:exodeoxyribonuclease VII large subunit [Parabacteroides sp. OttesenSCG-928-N08]|nr:exodeoxyribonuclease VII large subunit [Parabacteroides sp. OttesenSCG-928-N08]
MFGKVTESFDKAPQPLTLSELNSRVKQAVERAFPTSCLLLAEMSDVRINSASGHCYLEFIEKHPRTGQMVAKARGTIWANSFRVIKRYFEEETGQPFESGLKVMVEVNVDYHELYGFNLTVIDIDPTYTLGEMARKRKETIRKLQEDGVFELNKELTLPTLTQRIAIITSPTAAGYEDFMHQLHHNPKGFVFYTHLFPAIMQGEQTEDSVVAALDRIYQQIDCFDAVVIIRGGGATSELNAFDSYAMAATCAQFPLPVLTGIGHERDDTVLDMVAHTRLKTPTAVAGFLINRLEAAAALLEEHEEELLYVVNELIARQKNSLQLLASRLPSSVMNRLNSNRNELHGISSKLPIICSSLSSRRETELDRLLEQLRHHLERRINEQQRTLQLTEQFITLASPDYLLRRGYSLTMQGGKIIKSAADIQQGATIVTRFSDGEAESIVQQVDLKTTT